ncbi:hypothetical protein M3Y98_00840500 [Aphelenchoides besseyi]|nr:hypothetical protein M3Y98_00840500 [Aphelenchoides besseyi]KAI6195510.1 hypothetical protein M3Y96_01239000 [Aphelenchoides besseyi]
MAPSNGTTAEPEQSNSTAPERPPSKYASEFLYFMQNGRFEDDDPDLSEPLDENTPDRFDVEQHNYGQVIKTINEALDKSTVFKSNERERLKRGVVDVMIHQKPRNAAIKDHKLNCINFSTVLSNIYRRMNLTTSGAKRKQYPKYEMNLLEIQMDDFNQEDGDGKKSSKRKGKADDENGVGNDGGVGVSDRPKKVKKSAGSGYDGNPSSSRQHSHATITRRLGDAVPEHWKEYVDLTKYCIRKSVDLTITRGERNDITSTLNKCNAIETIILENANCKTAAASNNINYSTLHNYTHRAMYTIQKVLGSDEVPAKTLELLKTDATYDEICKKMGVKRAPTLARFVPKKPTDAQPETSTAIE